MLKGSNKGKKNEESESDGEADWVTNTFIIVSHVNIFDSLIINSLKLK